MAEKQSVTVRVDTREKVLDQIIAILVDHPEVEEFVVDELDSADLAIEGIGFERKTPSDYAGSITDEDDHLESQIERMKEQYEACYVLLDGDMSDFESLSHTRMAPESLRGFAASRTARDGVPTIPCSNLETLVDYAIRQARKHIEDPSGSSLRVQSSVEKKSEPVVKRMYGCIGGVGADTAASLHMIFPSLEDALSASVSEFETVDGVGPKTAQKIYDALHSDEVSVKETTI